jgi:nucleotide-binding universal stress UspA family protein
MRVLVAVDDSPESNTALRYACHVLEHSNSWVETLYVKPDQAQIAPEYCAYPFVEKSDLVEWIDTKTEAVEEQVLSAFDICSTGKVACWPRVGVGDPAGEILHTAEVRQIDMIVLGSSGRSPLKGFLVGAVHTRILQYAPQPVLIVRNFRPIRRVLVACRSSRCGRGALRFTGELLARKKPEITVLLVNEPGVEEKDSEVQDFLMQWERTSGELELSTSTKMVEGKFVEEILKEVAIVRHDLVVLGAYDRNRPKVLKVMSDEALELVRLANRPILVYRDRIED